MTGRRDCLPLRLLPGGSKPRASDGEAVVLGPDGLSLFEELRRREAADTAILYAFDLIEHDGDDTRNSPFLDRKNALARLLRNTRLASCSTNTFPRTAPSFSRILPAWGRGYRFKEDRQHLSIRPVPRLDQGQQSPPASPCSGRGARCRPMSLRAAHAR
jgi:hypothetical protein